MGDTKERYSVNRGMESTPIKPKNPGGKTKDAIFSIRERFDSSGGLRIHQTKGVACAVTTSGGKRGLLTWKGVLKKQDGNSIWKDKPKGDGSDEIPREMVPLEHGNFSFLPLGASEGKCMEMEAQNGRPTSDQFNVYSISGHERLGFSYDGGKDCLLLVSKPKKKVTNVIYGSVEESSVIGSPVVKSTGSADAVVVGVVGLNESGLFVSFIQQSDLDFFDKGVQSNSKYETDFPGHSPDSKQIPQENPSELEEKIPQCQAYNEIKVEVLKHQNEEIKLQEAQKQKLQEKNYHGIQEQNGQEPGTHPTHADGPPNPAGSGDKPQEAPASSEDALDSAVPVKKGQVDIKVLPDLALDVQNDWKLLRRELEMDQFEDDAIETDIKKDVYEQSFRMLCRWLESKGNEATYARLAAALRTVGLEEVRERYCLDNQSFSQSPVDLPGNLMKGRVPKEFAHTFVQAIAERWKRIGRQLGLDEHQLHAIEQQENVSPYEHCYQMLLKWKQSKGNRGATYENLANALLHRTVNMRKAVEKHLCK